MDPLAAAIAGAAVVLVSAGGAAGAVLYLYGLAWSAREDAHQAEVDELQAHADALERDLEALAHYARTRQWLATADPDRLLLYGVTGQGPAPGEASGPAGALPETANADDRVGHVG